MGSRWRVWGGRPGRTLCYGWLALKRSVRYSGRCVRSALHLDGNLRRCVRPPRPATRPVTMPFARCNATTHPPTSAGCCWVEVVQLSENGASSNSLGWYHFTSPGERPCPPMFPHSPDGWISWLSDLRAGRPRGWQRVVQCSSPSSVTGAGTPGCSRPTWRGRDGGLTIPWPSSNWWIKTGRVEDNEVEAPIVGKLRRCRPIR
jgi:hypothetical protein